jgi:nitrate/TMAO reductase-like tetraheme cytochrome c subunit
MKWLDRIRQGARFAFLLGQNPISLAGAALTTASAVTLLWFWLLEISSPHPVHPYAGIVLFLILPVLFVAGLALIPAGILWHRRRLARRGVVPSEYPRVDLRSPAVRNAVLLAGAVTIVNITLLGTATYKGVEYMESNQFCGLTCHNVMAPEYTAFLDSPHSRVGCVQCHIGPGAGWFVKSKLSGVRQVFAVALETYSRPIPSPVHDLRPARETCEQCHWPRKFVGDKFVVRTKYADDEKNTPSTTVLVLKVGGRTGTGSMGIHGRHLDDEERITYVSTDGRRELIPKVTYRDDDGALVDYVSEDVKATPADLARGETRKMDCLDCHNRPSHAFELPERAMDRALNEGRVSRDLPFVKKQAVELLRREYPDRETAEKQIADGLLEFYRTRYPEVFRQRRAAVESASVAVKGIYLRNVFPNMKVTWGTHPNHIGHEDFLGCFRCHDESHKTRDGRTITQDCSACHTILAQDETNPKVLAQFGLDSAPVGEAP